MMKRVGEIFVIPVRTSTLYIYTARCTKCMLLKCGLLRGYSRECRLCEVHPEVNYYPFGLILVISLVKKKFPTQLDNKSCRHSLTLLMFLKIIERSLKS